MPEPHAYSIIVHDRPQSTAIDLVPPSSELDNLNKFSSDGAI